MQASQVNFLLCAAFLLFLITEAPLSCASPAIKRPMEIVEATIEGGNPQTVDPAACYDAGSGELLMNCYDTLVLFDGEHVDRYLPQLATEWSIVQNNPPVHDPDTGLNFYWTYYFKIRQGVPFQNPAFGNLTTDDVRYCFQRGMIMDFSVGPQWMFYEPLLNGAYHLYVNGQDWDPIDNMTERELLGLMIDHAIESNSTHVWFNLAFQGVYSPFMQILAQPWSSIYSKSWANSLGRASNWPGNWPDHTSWFSYCDPATPPFDDPSPAVMGTGPFKLAHLDQFAKYWDADRFIGYWRSWPSDWPVYGMSRPAGYVDYFKVTWEYDWNTRSTMFLHGDVDFCAVPRQYINSMLGQPGIRCIYPLPSLTCNILLYNFNITLTSPYGPIYDYGQLNENGIPRDFFGNSTWGIHVRKAFSFSINFTGFTQQVYSSEAAQPATAIVPGVTYYDPTIKSYTFNLTRAAEEFQQVPDLWNTGFTIALPYNQGNIAKETLFNMTKQAIESLNPKFHVTLYVFSPWFWPIDPHGLPVSLLGWLGDYPDPHNFAYAFYYSRGYYAGRIDYNNSTMDALVMAGIATPDGPQRAQIYHDLQQLVIDDCPSVAIYQSFGRHFERDWICGWYYNPSYCGNYAANVWKWYYVPQSLNETAIPPTSDCLPFDINYDGKVNMYDIGAAATSFGAAYGPPTSSRWVYRCDFNNDRKIDMKDIAEVAKNFGKTSSIWTPSS